MRSAWIVVCALGIAGCSEAPRVDTIPADVEWVAFVLRDGGRIVLGTPLERVQLGETPALPDHDGAIDVVGFDDASIRALAPPDDRILEDPVFVATPCDVALPEPNYRATFEDGEPLAATPDIPVLSTSWLATRCPDFDPSTIAIDDTCIRNRCVPPIERDGCCLRLEMTDCGVSDVRLAIGAAGLRLADATPPATCQEQESPDGALVSFGCTEPIACRVDVYERAPADGLVFDRVELLDVPLRTTLPEERTALRTNAIYDGYLGDLVAFDDHVVVSTFGGEFRNFVCHDDQPAELVFIDAEALTITSRMTAPPCTGHIEADPRTAGHFFGAAGFDRNHSLVAFAQDGTVTASTALAVDSLPNTELTVRDLYVGGTPPAIYVVVDAIVDSAQALLVYELDLTLSTALSLEGRNVVDMISAPPEIVLLDDGLNNLLWYEPTRGDIVQTLPVASRGANHMANFLTKDDFIFIAGAGEFGAVHQTRKGEPSRPTKPFLFDASVTAIAEWSLSTWVVATTRHRAEDFRATVSLFDTERPRFLPQRIDVGEGAVSQIARRTDSEAFLLMNWTGHLVRVRAN